MTPLIFKSISIRNILSFGNFPQVLDLCDQGCTNILGENLDNGGSNASGKTGLINALCFALYNKPFGNISLDRLINRTNDSKSTQMEVRLVFEKNNAEYEIFRSRGKENTISFTRDGADITPGKGVTECDNLISEVIGISYELFTRIIIFSGTSIDFLQLPIAKQRLVIEELFGISILSEKAKLLKESVNTTNQDIKIIEAVIKQQEASNLVYKKQIKDSGDRIELWDKQTEKNITDLTVLLEKISKVNFEEEQLLHNKKAEIQQQNSALNTQLANKKKELTLVSTQINKDLNELEHLTDSKCPYCLQDFKNTKDKIILLNESVDKRTIELDTIETLIITLTQQLSDGQCLLKETADKIKHENFSELLKAKDSIVQNQTKLEGFLNAENPHIAPFELLLQQGEVPIDTNKLDELKERVEHQQFLLKLLTDKNSFLRQKIINKNIPFLNKRLNLYTLQLGLPHRVSFDADMSCSVSEFGRELDYDNLSQGEKKRVSTALMLAFRDVQHHLHIRDNLLFVDELDGGAMDILGIDAIVKTLKQLSKDNNISTFVISHHPAVVGRFNQTLYVRKEHGFSSISME